MTSGGSDATRESGVIYCTGHVVNAVPACVGGDGSVAIALVRFGHSVVAGAAGAVLVMPKTCSSLKFVMTPMIFVTACRSRIDGNRQLLLHRRPTCLEKQKYKSEAEQGTQPL